MDVQNLLKKIYEKIKATEQGVNNKLEILKKGMNTASQITKDILGRLTGIESKVDEHEKRLDNISNCKGIKEYFAGWGVRSEGGGGDINNLWYFADPTALNTAHPTATAGNFAIVGSTDTVWIWDDTTSAWKNSWTSSTGDVSWPASSTNENIAVFDWITWKLIKDSWKKLTDKQDVLAEGAFVDWDKTKLDWIAENANNYVLPADVVQDASYVHTDNNYTDADKNKLDWIEAGAEVNTINAGDNISELVNDTWFITSGSLKKTTIAMSGTTLTVVDTDITATSWVVWTASDKPNWFIEVEVATDEIKFTSTVAETVSFTYYVLI